MAETCNQIGRQHRITKADATKARRGEVELKDPRSFGVPAGDPQDGKARVALAPCRRCGKYVAPDMPDVEIA